MFRSTGFEKLLDKATSHLLMDLDWQTTLQICDLIRQSDVSPKQAFSVLKKKLESTNPHTAYYAACILGSIVKNCGSIVYDELTSKPTCDFLHNLVKTTTHQNLAPKLLELIQGWNFALRKHQKHANLKELVNNLKAEGFKFPALQESDAAYSTDTAPEWSDGDSCNRCRVQFTLIQRKHHCRACGQVFCGACTDKTSTLPKFGIEKEVRVCISCYEEENKPSTAKATKQESELPPEYLKSPLAQQSQEPPRKSEDELREEEELQLALALSRSEAEAKEKEKNRSGSAPRKTPVVEHSPTLEEERVEITNPELDRYLNRAYWEAVHAHDPSERATSPSAPSPASSIQSNDSKSKIKENGVVDTDLDEFIKTLKSQVEIFVNRMKSNLSRGRSIANDSSVQTLFMSITNFHSKLLKHIQDHDDRRIYYEGLQDKLTQVKDARAALDALREEHRDKLRRAAEEAEKQRQIQMANKLEIMRKKKQEYLQYQRQLALQRIQEQEREMQMRQEQQIKQYLMGNTQPYGSYMGAPMHTQQLPNTLPQPVGAFYPTHGQYTAMIQQQPNDPAARLGPVGQVPNQNPPFIGGQPTIPMGNIPPEHQQQFLNQLHVVRQPNPPPPSAGVPFRPQPGMVAMQQQGMVPNTNPNMPQTPQQQQQQAGIVGAVPMQNQQGTPQIPFVNQGTPMIPNQQQPLPKDPEQTQTAELISFD